MATKFDKRADKANNDAKEAQETPNEDDRRDTIPELPVLRYGPENLAT